MRARYFTLAGILAASGAAALSACATHVDEFLAEPAPEVVVPAPEAEAGADAAAPFDASDAAPCADCEYFPEVCTDDVLCQNGLFGTDGGLDPRAPVNVIRGRSASDVWIAGALGALAHFDGVSWTPSDLGVRETVHALWLDDSGEVSAASLQRLFSRGLDDPNDAGVSDGGWTSRTTRTPSAEYRRWSRTLVSGWSFPGSEWRWGVTTNHCASSTCLVSDPSPTSGVWRFRSSPVAPGSFDIADVISKNMCARISCGDMMSIHGSSANDLWAVGNGGAAVRITEAESNAPTILAFNTQTLSTLHGVWAASESEAWAVGAQGLVRHYSGHPVLWDIVSDVPTNEDLFAVWGSSPSDVWVVGDAATVLHYDGVTWSRVKIASLGARRPKLTAVWVPSPGHVWIGGQGVLLSLGGKP